MTDPSNGGQTRFWSVRGQQPNLDGAGFLLDPESPYAKPPNPELDQAHVDCLVLLGEPGMGKTTVLKDERDRISRQCADSGDALVPIDLGAYGDQAELLQEIFEAPQWDRWRQGSGHLHLFLDGLDECRHYIPKVAEAIHRRLQRLPSLDRIKLRIACRTGAWPHDFENALESLWPGERMMVVVLAPLRRRDVLAYAERQGISDPAAFLREVDQRGVGALAAKPITLRLLARLYQGGGRLPETQTELYEQGCLALCEESNQRRREGLRQGKLDAEQRLALAARIMAILVFCGRTAVWLGPDVGDRPGDDLTLLDLSGGHESCRGGEFTVNEAAIREVLSETGLFAARGPRRMGWAHRTFAEYLAARYVSAHGLAVEQVMSLIEHPEHHGRVVPQLHATAAWLAGMVPGVWHALAASDPALLLQGELGERAPEDREALVTAVLEHAELGRISDSDWELRRRFEKLAHPGLAGQLAPYLERSAKAIEARRMAVDIARSCVVTEAEDLLASIVLDPGEPLDLRVGAAYAVRRVGSDGTRARLKPLIDQGLDDDPNDDLRGCVLASLWPRLITSAELFKLLTPPKGGGGFYAYSTFLSRDVVPALSKHDLPIALAWVEGIGDPEDSAAELKHLGDQILIKAWEASDDAEVLAALASVVWARFMAGQEIVDMPSARARDFTSRPIDQDRRRVVEALFPRLTPADPATLDRLLFTRPPLLKSHDFRWLLRRLEASSDASEDERMMLGRLVSAAYLNGGYASLDPLLEAAERHPEVKLGVGNLMEPVPLDSPVAAVCRANYAQWIAARESELSDPTYLLPPQKVIDLLLAQVEAGKIEAWCQITLEMTREAESHPYGDTGHPDLGLSPGWREADEPMRRRIVEAAYRFARDAPGEMDDLSHDEHSPEPRAMAGIKALRLLLEHAPERLGQLTAEGWRGWVPAMLEYAESGREDHRSTLSHLYAHAYRNEPDAMLQRVAELIDERARLGHPMPPASALTGCWDDRIAALLLEKLTVWADSPRLTEGLLDELLDHGVRAARAYAESLLTTPLPAEEPARSRAAAAARALLRHTPDAGWTVIRPLLDGEPVFGRQLFQSFSQRLALTGIATFVSRLTEQQAAELFSWLHREFPAEEHPDGKGLRALGPLDYLVRLRDGTLNQLCRRGTAEAVIAIQELARALPELPYLRSACVDAERAMLKNTWNPPQPETLRKLVVDHEKRLVNSADQLLDVIVESLRRFEAKLHGATPTCFMLWDKQSDDVYRPKEEERFSDALKLHLEDDLGRRGIIANREVEIHALGRSAEYTDIQVDAVTPGPRPRTLDRVTVIIEVKGCWHPKVREAMQTQLRNEYLQENDCQHGLYVVGWYFCDEWDDSHRHKKDALRLFPGLTLTDAQAAFEAQAQALSRDGTTLRALVINLALS